MIDRFVRLRVLGAFVLTFLWSVSATAAEEAQTPRLELTACQPPLPRDALCGTHEVWEDREAERGRKVPLRVVVLPARGEKNVPEPLFYFSGGPGASAVRAAGFFYGGFPQLVEERDIVLVDARGTGESGALRCPYQDRESYVQTVLDHFISTEDARECREVLSERADLRFYTTPHIVDDADEVRVALGYNRIDLMGSSYGTRPALVYLRRHPESVRSAVLLGAASTDSCMPQSVARDAQQALDGVFAACAADAACHAAFPDLPSALQRALVRLDAGPLTIRSFGGDDHRLSRDGFAQLLRYMLYSPRSSALVPLAVHRAANGDLGALAGPLGLVESAGSLSEGFYLAVTCSEDVPCIEDDRIAGEVAGTFLGDFRIRRQRAACEGWPRGELSEGFRKPVRSDAPVLIVTGEYDPMTTVQAGERVARHLSRARHVVVAGGGHNFAGMAGAECVPGIVSQFLRRGSDEGLDTSCLTDVESPAFVLKLATDNVIELTPTQLARYAGLYVHESGFMLRIEVDGAGLRSIVEGQPNLRLLPLTPTRFTVVGLPEVSEFEFSVEGDEVRSVSVTIANRQQGTLRRSSAGDEP